MAAILKLRRGTSNASPSLDESELYLHQGSGSIQFGSGSIVPDDGLTKTTVGGVGTRGFL